MKRFERILKEGSAMASETEILVDQETGVHYLWHKSGYSGGLTVLLDEEGKPVIDKTVPKQ